MCSDTSIIRKEMESSCERMNCKTQKKTQLLCKSRAFEHLRISYRDTTVHAAPGCGCCRHTGQQGMTIYYFCSLEVLPEL